STTRFPLHGPARCFCTGRSRSPLSTIFRATRPPVNLDRTDARTNRIVPQGFRVPCRLQLDLRIAARITSGERRGVRPPVARSTGGLTPRRSPNREVVSTSVLNGLL